MSTDTGRNTSPAPGHDPAATVAYLDRLFGTAETGLLPIWTLEDRRTAWFPVADLAGAAAYASDRSVAGLNVYVGMGLQAVPLGPSRRGGVDTVVGIPGVWDDLDIAGPAHARSALPRTTDEALAVLAEFPLRYSLLVDSGHGLYSHWLFKEVWVFDGDDERRRAASLVCRLQGAIRAIARRHGYDLETTGDLARVLRPVGALNRKPGLPPALVRLLADTGLRYTGDDLEDVLPDEQTTPPEHRTQSGGSDPSADLDRVMAGCAFLRHCRDDAATLDEPAWHAMISVVARCRDGERLVHDLSAPYPRYDPEETDRKFAYALAADKPLRCATIRRDRGGEPYCAICPNAGTIASPVVLGRLGEPTRAVRRVRVLDPSRPLRRRDVVTLAARR